MPTPKKPTVVPRPAVPRPKPPGGGAELRAVINLLLALEETLVGSAPDGQTIRELYVKLKETV